MAYSETLRMEAALCIWEAMLEARTTIPTTGKRPSEDFAAQWIVDLDDSWEARGAVEMRHLAIYFADLALETFDLIGGHEGAEALDLTPYDWEFVPAFVARVDWTDCTADPAAIAASLKARKQGVAA